ASAVRRADGPSTLLNGLRQVDQMPGQHLDNRIELFLEAGFPMHWRGAVEQRHERVFVHTRHAMDGQIFGLAFPLFDDHDPWTKPLLSWRQQCILERDDFY